MTTSPNTIDRRKLLFSSAVVATIGVAGSLIYTLMRPAPRADTAKRPVRRPRRTVNVTEEELLKAGSLPDLVLGKADAPVTIVEYASMTCSHCASFHNTVLPVLKEKYIDTGKVRLIFREFPLDERAALASMMARCAGGDKALPLISMLFSQAGRVGDGEERLPAQALQVRPAGGIHQAVVRSVPPGREAHQGHHCGSRSRPIPVSASARRRPSSSTARRWTAASIEDFDKALAPLLKG